MRGRAITARLAATLIPALGVSLGACQSMAAPAVLTRADPPAMERLKATLAKAMDRASIELGPGDPSQTSVISVLPRPLSPLEDRSLAKPTIFRLEIEGSACVLVREDNGARIPLDGVECRAAQR
jgi:hypothetical protein